MNAENLVSFLLGQELDETIGIVDSLCSRVGNVRELARLVFNTGFLEFFFGFSDPCDFRMCVYD